ncbi:MAG: hypothetical protein E7289_06270 [Lachnospiraceae bacterium]|nr:hypothetical protein [Lachnospiraceae bacterium]
MDNFMDKLAKRFNAGELIQANGEAEARENQRLREKMDEYDKVMQEVRRLNLKTIEVSEQVSQMAACSIEQIESYQAPISEDDFAEDYTEDFANIREELGHIRENLLTLEKNFSDMEQRIVQSDDASYRLEASIRHAEDSIARIEETINQLGATVSRVELGNDTSQRSVEAAIRNLELTFAEKMQEPQEGEDETLAAINAALEAQSGLQQESAKQIKEMIVNVRLYMDEVQKHIEDYVHKEDVKVYRNVQAVVNEQLSLKTRDLNDHMDQIQKDVQKNKGTKSLVLIAVLLSGASVVLQVLQMLGIL